jgi:hypothetical protein
MENLIATLAPKAMELIGIILAGILTWGITLFKQKTTAEAGLKALDHVDRVTSTVVDSLTQTMAASLKEAAADGKLSADDISNLKNSAIAQTTALLSSSVASAATAAVGDLSSYIATKIEAQVLAQKK